MAGPQWSDDPDTPELNANLSKLYPGLLAHAASGADPSADLAKEWHTQMHEGVSVPHPDYVGRFRGDTPTVLLGLENRVETGVGGIPGTRSWLVFGEVEKLVAWLVAEVAVLEAAELSLLERDLKALEIAAVMHGEWVRIHPFANGNGRTARLWAAWVLARFEVPPLLKIRPRPEPPYGTASYSSMTGDHSAMLTLLKQNYAALPTEQRHYLGSEKFSFVSPLGHLELLRGLASLCAFTLESSEPDPRSR